MAGGEAQGVRGRFAQPAPVQRALLGAAWAVAGSAVALTVWRGFNGASRRLDARPLILAGYAWVLGESPYANETYSRLWQQVFHSPRPESFVFAYPPSAALILAPLALRGVDVGLVLLDLLNLVSLSLALFLCARLGGESAAAPSRGPRRAVALALTCACGSLSGTLLLGQTSLWVLSAVLWLWLCTDTSRLRIAEVFAVSVAAMKPSLTLPLLCFLAVLHPRLVAAAAAFSIAVCAVVAASTGGPAVFAEWLQAVVAYSAASANAPVELASAQRLFDGLAPGIPAWPLAALGGLGGGLIGWDARRRSCARADGHWIAAVALAAACSPAHAYDLVLGAPLAALLPRIRPVAWAWYGLGVLAVARPAPLAGLAASLAGADATALEGLISAIGTVLLAAGAGAHLMLRRPLLAGAE